MVTVFLAGVLPGDFLTTVFLAVFLPEPLAADLVSVDSEPRRVTLLAAPPTALFTLPTSDFSPMTLRSRSLLNVGNTPRASKNIIG